MRGPSPTLPRRWHWRLLAILADAVARYGVMGQSTTIGNAKLLDQVRVIAAALPADPIAGEHAPHTRCEACHKNDELACQRHGLVPLVTPGCLLFVSVR